MEVVKFLQSMSNGFFDFFFNSVTMLGEEVLVIALLIIVYFAINKRFGEYLGYSIISSIMVNNSVKMLFQAPRPFELDAAVENMRPDTATGYSFPSGHTQTASSTYFSIFAFAKKNLWLVIAIVFTVLVAVSRMYLGVHFPQDVIVGALLGAVLPFVFLKLFNSTKCKHKLFIISALCFLPFAFFKGGDWFKTYGLYWGFILGVIIENKYINFEMTKVIWKNILRVVIALALVMIAKEGLKLILPVGILSDFVRYVAVSLMGIGLSPFIIKKLKI